MTNGLFVGLITLDFLYLADHPPQNNEKMVAKDYTIAAGGPATNAAVAFQALGNQATVLGGLGCHPVSQLARSDLENWGITILDLDPDRLDPLPVSSIVVTESTGERAVVSLNAVKHQISPDLLPQDCLQDVDVVLIDGHQMQVGTAIAQHCQMHNIPVVIDAGSWKPGFEQVLPYADVVIASANFRPPHCNTEAEVFAYLMELGVPQIAVTHGEQPIEYWNGSDRGQMVLPKIQAVDTLGAGDIFHGAFCHYCLQVDFTTALAKAAAVAALSCQFFGTRQWINQL